MFNWIKNLFHKGQATSKTEPTNPDVSEEQSATDHAKSTIGARTQFSLAMSKTVSVASDIWSKFSYIVIFTLMFILYLIVSANGLSWAGIVNILRHSAIIGIIALGMGTIIITGNIDLSVGSALVLVGGLTIMIFNATGNIFLTLIMALLLGGVCGFINGFLIGKLKMPAFIVTLATMLIFRSISQYMMNELGFTFYTLDANLEAFNALFHFGNDSILTIPIIGIFLILVTAAMIYLMNSTKFGKQVYAVGSNRKGAKLAGIHVEWTQVIVYVIAGVLVGFATFLHVASQGSVTPATTGKNYELYAIAGVVIGGISMSGGKGKIAGIIFGVMAFTIIDKVISALALNPLMNDSIKGFILLIAILLQILKKKSK